MRTIDILRKFQKAERTGQCREMHLEAIADMLPFMAAAGHNLYTKSLTVYLNDMRQLESENPSQYNKFLEGFQVIRRSDREWAGLSIDLAIEQCLMRSLKVTGGPVRASGMSESNRTT